MTASMTALATVVWSDFAEASEPARIELADDVLVQPPVKLAKIEHKVVEEDVFGEIDEPRPMKKAKRKGRLDFGSFEGY